MPELTIVVPSEATALDRLVDDYLASCRARGLSPKTVKFVYAYVLKSVFLPFCRREGVKQPDQVTRKLLDRFSTELLDTGGSKGPLSKHSVHSYVRSVNSFLAWASREGEVGADTKAQLPKLGRRLLEVLSREEIQAMEDVAKTERDKLIVRVLADTGIRLGELVGLRTSDVVVQGRRHYIRVRGKGDLERLVPLAPTLYARVRRYIDRARPRDVATESLFIALRRSPAGDLDPLTASGVEQMIKIIAQVAGVEKRVYPHLLRHSFVTWSLTRGMNPIQLAQIVGHTSLAMIQQVYAHLTPTDAYDAQLRVLVAED
jgi:integrase/recombinase XerD